MTLISAENCKQRNQWIPVGVPFFLRTIFLIFKETYGDADFGRKLPTAKSMDTLVGRLDFFPTEPIEFSKMPILTLIATQKCKQRHFKDAYTDANGNTQECEQRLLKNAYFDTNRNTKEHLKF